MDLKVGVYFLRVYFAVGQLMLKWEEKLLPRLANG